MARIERQIRWLAQRQVKRNRLGMLRAAIVQDWPEPTTGARGELGAPNLDRPTGASFGEALAEATKRLQPRANTPS